MQLKAIYHDLKCIQKEVSEISEYDPLDMFSGSKDRVHKAIKALFVTPQNNFRVFLNGALVFGGLGGGMDSTSCMIGKAFEDVLKCVIQADDGLRTTNFLQVVAEAVFKSSLLDLVLEVQKLDTFDIEGAIHAYCDIISQPCMICKNSCDDKLSGRYTSLHSISLDESLKIVRNYLIAATAKDLSMMISFRPQEDTGQGSPYSVALLESTYQGFEYKASLFDLDMEPLKKMEHYYELDQQIVSCYTQKFKMELHPDTKICKDWDLWYHTRRSISHRGKYFRLEILLVMDSSKTVVSVDLLCSKCRTKVMKLISTVEGINSIVLDPPKNTVTVIGEADPVRIIKKVRKFRKSAQITSIGPPKEEKKDEKKDEKKVVVPSLPSTCQKCNVWYAVVEDHYYNPCHIL